MCIDAAVLDHECLAEMHEIRKSLVEDYQVNPQLVRDCSHEIAKFCGGRIHRAGRTVHCLMNLAQSKKQEDDTAISARCARTVSDAVFEIEILPVIVCIVTKSVADISITYEGSMLNVFWHQQWFVGDVPFYLKFWCKVIHHSSSDVDFDNVSAIRPSKKV